MTKFYFAKRLPGLLPWQYKSRLDELDAESLEQRRSNYDSMLTCKMLLGLVDMKASELFTYAQTGNRM
jgi:hypothetical protein